MVFLIEVISSEDKVDCQDKASNHVVEEDLSRSDSDYDDTTSTRNDVPLLRNISIGKYTLYQKMIIIYLSCRCY